MGASSSCSEGCCFPRCPPRRPAATDAPVRVAISGAAGHIGYSLLPMIARGDMFGPKQRVALQCLDLNQPATKDNMRGINMELQDGNFELLQEAIFTVDVGEAFAGADYAILVGAFPQKEGIEKEKVMEMNSMIFRTLGQAIAKHARKSCKVIVVGHPACTNALFCAHHAPSIPKEQFFAMTRLDQNRATAQIAERAGVSVGDVKNVIIWGSHARAPDVQHVEVRGLPIRTVLSKKEDQQWLREEFIREVEQRGPNILKARQAGSAMSAACAVVDTIRDLHCGTAPGRLVSLGVWSDGNEYGVSNGLIFSMPAVCSGNGCYQIALGLHLGHQSWQTIREAEAQLSEERNLALTILEKHRRLPAICPASQEIATGR